MVQGGGFIKTAFFAQESRNGLSLAWDGWLKGHRARLGFPGVVDNNATALLKSARRTENLVYVCFQFHFGVAGEHGAAVLQCYLDDFDFEVFRGDILKGTIAVVPGFFGPCSQDGQEAEKQAG